MHDAMPEGWLEVIEREVPHVGCLPVDKKERLGELIRAFLADKRFEGAMGFEITDQVRLVIAAQACILLIGLDGVTLPYPNLRSIIVYPSAYQAQYKSPLAGGLEVESGARLGEWSTGGAMVLSWDHVVRGARDPRDGQNVVFHEFAHALDGEDGPVDGAPSLEDTRHYTEWARVFQREYDRHRVDLQFGVPTVIDGYGATKPQEFFATATEAFFEKPEQLRAMHPELYERMADFFRQDPAAWTCAKAGRPLGAARA